MFHLKKNLWYGKDPVIHDVQNDNIHFCRDAQMQLGKRYFEKFIKLR